MKCPTPECVAPVEFGKPPISWRDRLLALIRAEHWAYRRDADEATEDGDPAPRKASEALR